MLVGCIVSLFAVPFFTSIPDAGMVGASSALLAENWVPDYIEGYDFFWCLSVFFPAATGIMAGANMSAEIKNPHYSIPYGTLGAVVMAGVVYCFLAVMIGSSVQRASDDSPDSCVRGEQAEGCAGLLFDYLVMIYMSWKPLIFAGIYAATLSSAIACMVGAPRILLSVAEDNLFPVLQFFSVTHGPNREPIRGYLLSFAISAACIIIGDLNIVAPLITAFFMLSYALVNFACWAGMFEKSKILPLRALY